MSMTKRTCAGLSCAALLCASTLAAADCENGGTITLADLQAIAPAPPADVCTNATHTQLANFAWREFIALNNAASTNLPSDRGQPNPGGSFEDTGHSSAGPLVWETFAHRTELLPANQTSLQPWGSSPEYVYSSLTISSSQAQYNNLDESTEIGQNYMFFPTTPPSPAMSGSDYDPDSDQQILYEAKVNETEYNYVAQNLSAIFGASSTTPIQLPAGSIEIKAGWRRVNSTIDASRYHTSTVNYYTDNGSGPQVETATYALVGLHIIHKTANYPTFIYATFEQVDAMKTPAGGDTGLYYVANYTDVAYEGATPNNTAPQATFPTGSTSTGSTATGSPSSTTTVDLPVGDLATFYASQNPAPASGSKGIPDGLTGPITVIQEPLISNDVVAVNQNVLSLMQASGSGFENSVWQYYQLKGVQGVSYPTNSYPDNLSTNVDYYLANIVIESSQPGVQLFSGKFTNGRAIVDGSLGVTVNAGNVTNPYLGASDAHTFVMGGCQGCHGNAQQSGHGFSFLLNNGAGTGPTMIKGFSEPDVVGLPETTTAAVVRDRYSAHNP